MNQNRRIVVEMVVGIAISALIFSSLICYGYWHVSSANNITEYVVTCLGLPIYRIGTDGSHVAGEVLGQAMSMLGACFSVVFVVCCEFFIAIKNSKKASKPGR